MSAHTVGALSITELRLMIKAVCDLKRKYLDKKMKHTVVGGYTPDCPLCDLDEKIRADVDWCFCPWEIIDRRGCCGEGGYYNQNTEEKLERCNRWLKVLLKEYRTRWL